MNAPLKCLIVEDEPLAAEVLEDYIREVPFLELKGTCTDAIYALEALQNQPIDVIFLDIHLPKLKGLDFLRTLSNAPQVILTTAYYQYALESYELAVVDYLLKPIEFSRFLKAVNKLKRNIPSPVQTSAPTTTARAFHFFNVNKKQVKVYLDEVLFVESLKEYVRIYTLQNQLVTQYQIGALEQILPPPAFLRIHRSFLVAVDKIEAFSATEISVGGQDLPIGKTYKVWVGEVLEREARR
ncbi:MAG: DNA-binding response regulator [Saprospiraceae bacterium]|nr:MAG: DNA-binding response regulator [Saprospiraceae bacterium]